MINTLTPCIDLKTTAKGVPLTWTDDEIWYDTVIHVKAVTTFFLPLRTDASTVDTLGLLVNHLNEFLVCGIVEFTKGTGHCLVLNFHNRRLFQNRLCCSHGYPSSSQDGW